MRDVLADMAARPDGSRLVLAHRRADVQALNGAIRGVRQVRGELADERVYRTAEGERAFAAGDRLLFRQNSRELGVKNGMLGTVERTGDGRLDVRLDAGAGVGRLVSVAMADYAAVDHGYATTIHKSQGATVDRAYVLASDTMDRHLAYVAMTRHRDEARLYAGRDEFRDLGALTTRLSRSQAKETTLDHAAYAERRGVERREPEAASLDIAGGMAAARAQFRQHQEIEAGKARVREMARQRQAEQAARRQEQERAAALERQRLEREQQAKLEQANKLEQERQHRFRGPSLGL